MISIDPQAVARVPEAPGLSGKALSKAALTRFLNRALSLVELEGGVELLLTSDAELKRLNRAFRNKNKATDILSFPSPAEVADHHAGDLAISLETAARQAGRFGHTLDEELRILILHGLLHLSGLDHETDNGEMAAVESELRTLLKLPTSLISRVTTKPSGSSPQISKPRHPERSAKRVVEGPPHLPSARTGKKSAGKATKKTQPPKRAKGPSNTSLGRSPRSRAPKAKRAESPTQRSNRKPPKKKAPK